jgi:hypothetical protein
MAVWLGYAGGLAWRGVACLVCFRLDHESWTCSACFKYFAVLCVTKPSSSYPTGSHIKMRPLDMIRVGAPAEEPAATNRRYEV